MVHFYSYNLYGTKIKKHNIVYTLMFSVYVLYIGDSGVVNVLSASMQLKIFHSLSFFSVETGMIGLLINKFDAPEQLALSTAHPVVTLLTSEA